MRWGTGGIRDEIVRPRMRHDRFALAILVLRYLAFVCLCNDRANGGADIWILVLPKIALRRVSTGKPHRVHDGVREGGA